MSRFILFFQSKIALAIIGAVLLGGAAALIASASFSATPNQPTTNQPQTLANIANGNGTATPGASPSATRTPGTSPTATPTPRSPTPTPTSGSGQTTSIHGTVTSVNASANQFTVSVFGGTNQTVTVIVTAQTTFQGACTSLNGLHTGWRVDVQGAGQGSSFTASSVTSSHDD